MTAGLVAKGLVAGYRGRSISKVSYLSVAPGGAAMLGGRSGAGKTTLLLAIAGLADRLDGAICLDDVDLAGLPPRRRDRHRGEHIGLVFQDLHLVPGLSAVDNMLLAPFASGARPDRARAVALLERLGVGHRARARAETLSRGEAQRVAIARTTLMNPRLILADEPTASLDDEAAAAVIDLLLEATRESGAALVVATHDARVRARVGQSVEAEAA
ncbi:ABC transporter ATP-binding protein [uncultured Sphingomonas sp.]|uniref:ABC transporter ATP-binding protein n=1 Tax=uncultured Sphingomonas sp. TaxID=158754 RepID=UPI0035CAEF1C